MINNKVTKVDGEWVKKVGKSAKCYQKGEVLFRK